MALGIKTENAAGGNLAWLGSRHGVAQAMTGTLKADAFTDKTVLSGTPVAYDSATGTYGPYTDGATQALAGFVINDANVADGDEPVAILDHGRIRVKELPVEGFTAPESSAFVFVDYDTTPGA